jgi:hypothetical protein
MPRTTLHATLGLVVSLACATLLSGQQASATSPTTLRHEIELADSIMFAAYHAHDGDQLGRYLAPDLEF